MKAIVKFNTLFLSSEYDTKTLEKVAKYRPDALQLVKGEGDDKEVVCAMGVSNYCEGAGVFGITFANDSVTEPHVAVTSVRIPPECTTAESINNWIREHLGMAIVNCNKIEDQIKTALVEIAADEATMNAAITIENETVPEAAADAEG